MYVIPFLLSKLEDGVMDHFQFIFSAPCPTYLDSKLDSFFLQNFSDKEVVIKCTDRPPMWGRIHRFRQYFAQRGDLRR